MAEQAASSAIRQAIDVGVLAPPTEPERNGVANLWGLGGKLSA